MLFLTPNQQWQSTKGLCLPYKDIPTKVHSEHMLTVIRSRSKTANFPQNMTITKYDNKQTYDILATSQCWQCLAEGRVYEFSQIVHKLTIVDLYNGRLVGGSLLIIGSVFSNCRLSWKFNSLNKTRHNIDVTIYIGITPEQHTLLDRCMLRMAAHQTCSLRLHRQSSQRLSTPDTTRNQCSTPCSEDSTQLLIAPHKQD